MGAARGRPWTAEDKKKLREMMRAGATVKICALALNRTEKATQVYIATHRLRDRWAFDRGGMPWSPGEDDRIVRFLADHGSGRFGPATFNGLAAELERSAAAVRAQAYRLKRQRAEDIDDLRKAAAKAAAAKEMARPSVDGDGPDTPDDDAPDGDAPDTDDRFADDYDPETLDKNERHYRSALTMGDRIYIRDNYRTYRDVTRISKALGVKTTAIQKFVSRDGLWIQEQKRRFSDGETRRRS